MSRMTGVEMAEIFSKFINSGSSNERIEFAEEVVRDHKTLQEDSFRAFLNCIEMWAGYYDSGNYDGRNQYTVKASKIMIQALKDEGMY